MIILGGIWVNEKEAITSVVAIGVNTQRYLEKIQALMSLEEADVRDCDVIFERGLKISQFNFISANVNLNTSVIKESINDNPVCFLIVDAGDRVSLNYAGRFSEYIQTLDCGLSIALLFGNYNDTLLSKEFATELYSKFDVIIDLDNLASDDTGKTIAAYNIIRGINSTLVKPLLCGFDLADLHLHLKSSGRLQVAWAIESNELDNLYDKKVCMATQSALEEIKKHITIEDARRVFIFIEGNEDYLNIKSLENSVMMIDSTFPKSIIEWVASTSKTIGNEVRVLIGATNI